MAINVQFTRGANTFGLTTAPYSVGLDFTLPAVNMAYNVSSGTSANMNGGGSLIGARANNRAFGFTVRIMATNMNEAGSYARRLAGFINVQSSDPLFIDYRENSDIPVPLWGQFGAPLRFEVVTCNVGNIDELYAKTSGHAFFVTVTAEVKPLAVGQRQKLLNARGGVFEDSYGTADGMARGLGSFEGTTNKMTNPVFGAATWNTGWTTAVEAVAKNTDSRYVLPGLLQSVKIVAAGSNNVFYQSINAGNTNKHSFSAYIMLPNGGTPTNADVLIYYNVGLATSFQDLGNGLWCAYVDNMSGINLATATGLLVLSGRSCYLLGFQMEEKAYHTPLSYGDLLGNSWSGTAHASTSVRAAAVCVVERTDDTLSIAQGAVQVVWRPYYANTFGASEYFWAADRADLAVLSMQANFFAGDDKIYLTDGLSSISTAAQTFSAGDVMVLTFVWGPAGLAIYKNGVLAASGATYTPPAAVNSATLVVGAANTGSQCNGTLMGFDVYATQLSQAQVTAMYTAASAIVNGGGRVSTVPWLWSKDGDGIVDNCDDSTRDNWCVAGGVPGSIEAKTHWDVTPSTMAKTGYWLMCSKLNQFAIPSGASAPQNYYDISGTVDANASGGAAHAFSTASGDGSNYSIEFSFVNIPGNFNGKVSVFARCSHSTAVGTFTMSPFFRYNAGGNNQGAFKPVRFGAATTYYWFYLGDIDLSLSSRVNALYSTMLMGIGLTWAGATGILYTDYLMFVQGEIARLTGGSGGSHIILDGNVAYRANSGGETIYSTLSMVGNIIDLAPGKTNIVWFAIGDHAESNVITDTATLLVAVTPRYGLL